MDPRQKSLPDWLLIIVAVIGVFALMDQPGFFDAIRSLSHIVRLSSYY